MKNFRSPTTKEMVAVYRKTKAIGLQNIRPGNLGVFVKTEKDQRYLMENVERNSF